MGRDILIVNEEEQRDTEDMLNRFYFSAKDILIQNGYLANSTSFRLKDYELFMSNSYNSSMNLTMKSCSLSKELDNVSNDSSTNSFGA